MTENDDDDEYDEYDVFLETFEGSERLSHAILPQNLDNQISKERLLDDSTGEAKLDRTTFKAGIKVIEEDEEDLIDYGFFEKNQATWSEHFRDYVLCAGLDETKFNDFIKCFANLWVDGKSRRQNSNKMMAIKASIRDHDLLKHSIYAGKFVLNEIYNSVAPLFTSSEMEMIFTANESLLETFMGDYLVHVGSDGPKSINGLYVRRGVYMPESACTDFRKELYYLSSYSLTLTLVEQFALTWTQKTRGTGIPSIFSAPLPAIQNRVVAFAPFIEGMDLGQLEIVVAPPIVPTTLKFDGEHGKISEYSFE